MIRIRTKTKNGWVIFTCLLNKSWLTIAHKKGEVSVTGAEEDFYQAGLRHLEISKSVERKNNESPKQEETRSVP